MVKARVKSTFTCKGRTYTPGTVVRFPEDDMATLSGFVEVLPDQSLTPYERKLQNRSTEWQGYCDQCERQVHGGMCPHKRHERLDPYKHCRGWQIKRKGVQ